MAVLVLPERAKYNTITRRWKLNQEFFAWTHLFTRMSVGNPTHKEIVALAP
jgi:hypothetical protein